eukprot:5274142-Pyramimonas_sp.AAC.1
MEEDCAVGASGQRRLFFSRSFPADQAPVRHPRRSYSIAGEGRYEGKSLHLEREWHCSVADQRRSPRP